MDPGLPQRLAETANALRARVAIAPRVGIVLGTGLGGFGERMRDVTRVPYSEVPHMPLSKVPPQEGAFYLGFVDDVPVVCLDGRAHLYEGFRAWEVVHGVRVMAQLGARLALVTNAAGSLHADWPLGTLMVVVDHVDLMAHEPLVGLGRLAQSPFPDMRLAYDATLREELHAVARAESLLSARIRRDATEITLVEGVYAGLRDPSCETAAQIKMLRTMGADAIGMSTIPEVVALRQLGVRVAALSYIAYHAAGVAADEAEDEMTSRLGLTELHRIVRAWTLHADRL